MIGPKPWVKVPTNIAVQPQEGTYCQVWSRRGLLTRHGIEVKAGTIDRNYMGDVIVVMYNNSCNAYPIHHGDKIAQLIMHRIAHSTIQETNLLALAQRGANGFGSTDDTYPASSSPTTLPQPQDPDSPHTTTEQILHQILVEDNIKPYNIWFHNDPYHKQRTVSIRHSSHAGACSSTNDTASLTTTT